MVAAGDNAAINAAMTALRQLVARYGDVDSSAFQCVVAKPVASDPSKPDQATKRDCTTNEVFIQSDRLKSNALLFLANTCKASSKSIPNSFSVKMFDMRAQHSPECKEEVWQHNYVPIFTNGEQTGEYYYLSGQIAIKATKKSK